MNIETSTVTKQNDVIFVENIEDMLIRVNARQVRKIMENTLNVEEKEVVVLLATIKQSRIIQTPKSSRGYEKVDEDVANISITKLLNCFSIDNLISLFEDMKYYQIKDVLEHENPVKRLHDFL